MAAPKPVYKPGDRAGPGRNYRVVSMIGAGGMGEVYRVERDGGGVYAYKTLQFRHHHNKFVMDRFQAEAAAGREMLHANLVRVLESGLDEHGGYIVMDLLDGQSLQEILRDGHGLSVDRILEIGVEVADALHALHLAKIVHRDVKPGNVFITRDGRVLLLDLGAAKFERYGMNTTQSQGPTGTVIFMSPEHLNPDAIGVDAIDGRSDVYSLGLLLFFALSGEHAVLFGREPELLPMMIGMRHVLSDQPSLKKAAPELHDAIVKVIDRATRRRREDRYACAADFATTLRALRSWWAEHQARGSAAAAPEPTPSPPPGLPAGVGPKGTVRIAPVVSEASPVPPPVPPPVPSHEPPTTTPLVEAARPVVVAARAPLGAPVQAPVPADDEMSESEKRRFYEAELEEMRRQQRPLPTLAASPRRASSIGRLVVLGIAVLLAGVGGAFFLGRTAPDSARALDVASTPVAAPASTAPTAAATEQPARAEPPVSSAAGGDVAPAAPPSGAPAPRPSAPLAAPPAPVGATPPGNPAVPSPPARPAPAPARAPAAPSGGHNWLE